MSHIARRFKNYPLQSSNCFAQKRKKKHNFKSSLLNIANEQRETNFATHPHHLNKKANSGNTAVALGLCLFSALILFDEEKNKSEVMLTIGGMAERSGTDNFQL